MKGSSFFYLLKTGFKNLWNNRLMTVASIGVLVACMMLIGMASLLSLNVRNIVGSAGEDNEVVVFLEDDLSEEEIEQVGIDIQKLGNIKDVTYVSKEEALETEQAKDNGADCWTAWTRRTPPSRLAIASIWWTSPKTS